MSKIYNFEDNMLLLATYNQLQSHKHLAYHLIIALGNDMKCIVSDNHIKCRGICIKSNIEHSGNLDEKGGLIFFFAETSKYVPSIKKIFLNNKNYAILDEHIVNEIIATYYKYYSEPQTLNDKLLNKCNLYITKENRYNEIIEKVLNYIHNLETITPHIMDDLAKEVFLSKSRLSHIFKSETNMTLHSYLAYAKLKKTYSYLLKGKKLTDACLLAGFNSSSHCSSTCKKMFGISFRDFSKT